MNIVFIPGIFGSSLYASDGTEVWGQTPGRITEDVLNGRMALANSLANPNLTPGGLNSTYNAGLAALRCNGKNTVYPLAYDWRLFPSDAAAQLELKIAAVPDPKILVGHSYGGLVALVAKRQSSALGVVTFGSPLSRSLAGNWAILALACGFLLLARSTFLR